MRFFGLPSGALLLACSAAGAPIIKSLVVTLGAEDAIATGVYGVASAGASFAVEHTGLISPLLSSLPGAQVVLGAANLLGGRFAGNAAGGIASNAARGFIEGERGNGIPLIGWIIRDEKTQERRVDDVQAASAGNAVSSSIDGLVSAVSSLGQFKSVIHPDTVAAIATVEIYGGFLVSLPGWIIKIAVYYVYNSNAGNHTPYIGELIRTASKMIAPEHEAFGSLGAELALQSKDCLSSVD
ncbi:hypothetical protein GQ54DRAFT_312320 [Martensiomyces pterosporus]|nr:hypothetical protein GQ54DRAFT_312320 [Martensiomyces pterosporus]